MLCENLHLGVDLRRFGFDAAGGTETIETDVSDFSSPEKCNQEMSVLKPPTEKVTEMYMASIFIVSCLVGNETNPFH